MQDVVLIPGLLCTAELYAPQLKAFRDVARVHVADHACASSMSDIAAMILAKSPKTFALCGLSMGGYLSFEIMRQAPERVTKLALLDTAAKADTPERSAERFARVAQAERDGLLPVARSMWPYWMRPAGASDPALLEIAARMTSNTGVAHFARQQAAIARRADSVAGLGAIKVPTLVLVGREDQATTVADAEVIAGGIKGSKLVVIEACAHLSTLEQPEAVNRALMTWLGG